MHVLNTIVSLCFDVKCVCFHVWRREYGICRPSTEESFVGCLLILRQQSKVFCPKKTTLVALQT